MIVLGNAGSMGLAMGIVLMIGCTQVVTLYWSKPGAGTAELLADKEKCQELQRSVGLNEDRIEKCLEAQGWTPVREEVGAVSSTVNTSSK